MKGGAVMIENSAVAPHHFRIVTGDEERNRIAVPLNCALIVGLMGDVGTVIRSVDQQPVFEFLLPYAFVNAPDEFVSLEDGCIVAVDDCVPENGKLPIEFCPSI